MTNSNNETEEEPGTILPDWKRVFVNREEFLKLVGLASGGLITLLLAIPNLAFAFNYLLLPKREQLQMKWINIGPTDKYKEGETVSVMFEDPYTLPWEGVTGKRSAWLRRISGDKFVAFALNCTHLGCPVRWEKEAELFLCPCHGGVYYADGEVAGGPPPRPLHQYPVRVSRGKVEIKVHAVLNEG